MKKNLKFFLKKFGFFFKNEHFSKKFIGPEKH